MYVDICRFENGIHVSGPLDCPHTQAEDERGVKQPVGWTVQNADAYRAYLTEERERDARER